MAEDREQIYQAVRERYSRAATSSSCCSAESSCCATPCDEAGDVENLIGPSLGCGNPLAKAALKSGETVLDIGSGAGVEVIRAAKAVGAEGTAYGLDMTDEMLALALRNKKTAGAMNAHFIKGTMENIPLPSESVDVIISNCVINLSPDKQAALSELFRVLKPGGRLAVSDTVVKGDVPEDVRKNADLWGECLSGSMSVDEYTSRLQNVGFGDISVNVEGWYSQLTMEKDGWQAGAAFVSATRPGSTESTDTPVQANPVASRRCCG